MAVSLCPSPACPEEAAEGSHACGDASAVTVSDCKEVAELLETVSEQTSRKQVCNQKKKREENSVRFSQCFCRCWSQLVVQKIASNLIFIFIFLRQRDC